MIVLIQRGWQAFSGLVTLYFVTRYLGPVDQGFYYTITTLVGMMLALDMGLNHILVPLASKYSVGQDAQRHSYDNDFLSVGHYAVKWFLFTGIVMLLFAPLGDVFLNLRSPSPDSHLTWSWYAVVVVTTAFYMISPFALLLEGTGRVKEVYTHRLCQGLLSSLGMWGAFSAGAGLLSAAVPPLLGFVYTGSWLMLRHRQLIWQVQTKQSGLNWRTKIWPIQWRTGTNIFSGYLLVFAYTPLYFLLLGPKEAGQIGLTMACVNTIYVLAMSGLASKLPALTRMLVEDRLGQANLLFKQEARKAEMLYGIIALGFLVTLYLIRQEAIAQRFMSLGQVCCILVGMFFYLKANALGYFLRAHLVDRTFKLNLIAFVMVVSGGGVLSYGMGAWGVPLVTLLVFSLFLLPATSRAVVSLTREGAASAMEQTS